MKGHIAAIVLVVLGVFFLLTNLGLFFTPGDKKK